MNDSTITKVKTRYPIIGGVPHKWKDGKLVSLTSKGKRLKK